MFGSSSSSIYDFYNKSRSALKPTTLHDGNIPRQTYNSVVQSRVSLTCYESYSHKHFKHDNKENRYK
uniref:ORF132 n=1 Tax=Spodoptera frugiperda granulovirus TaxID=307454 RepID=A0A346QW52_9BBAC|nr:ORF132 [Spodoptera frugiperda granulovirus]